jgi:hypothetical protein
MCGATSGKETPGVSYIEFHFLPLRAGRNGRLLALAHQFIRVPNVGFQLFKGLGVTGIPPLPKPGKTGVSDVSAVPIHGNNRSLGTDRRLRHNSCVAQTYEIRRHLTGFRMQSLAKTPVVTPVYRRVAGYTRSINASYGVALLAGLPRAQNGP